MKGKKCTSGAPSSPSGATSYGSVRMSAWHDSWFPRPPMREMLRHPSQDRPASADEWFTALDQRCVGGGADVRRVLVTGVHHADGDFWIQLTLGAVGRDSLVLHVPPGTRLDTVLELLELAHARRLEERVLHVRSAA